MSRKTKTVVTIIILATAMTLMSGCKNKSSINEENPKEQTEQNDTNEEGNKEEDSEKAKEVNIDEWKFDVPEGYEVEENSGPWYEKRYANKNGAVLLFGYYAPNAPDNKTDKQLFDDQVNSEKQDLINRYGNGEITYQDINSDKMYITTYYETRDLKVLKRSMVQGQVWKKINIEIPISENEKDFESILDIIK
ncbi:MAG: hypothetical protein K0R09_2881 [Clostridiales bacterium]|nr:hypothetical protein [Clostridiales bacterium]